MEWTGMFQEDFAQQTQTTSSLAIPTRQTRKASLQMQKDWGLSLPGLGDGFSLGVEAGALWAGQPFVGETFQLVTGDAPGRGEPYAPEDIRQDVIKDKDTFGARGKVTLQKGRWNWYGQGSYMGLVAEGGPTAIPTFTGWGLRDSGSGNQIAALSGLAVNVGGNFQVGPNFLWQKPIVAPMPHSDDLAGTAGRPRNVLDDPFAVRWNRETTGAELMLTYDPTPATWLWSWDSDTREDAAMAASLSFIFKRHHTTADAGLYVSDQSTILPHPGATPPRDLWEIRYRLVNRTGTNSRMITHLYFGTAEPNGDDTRLIYRHGLESRIAWPSVAVEGHVKLNDFGPYDYHHEFNLTFPLQLMGDISFTLGTPQWFSLPQTRFGVRGTFRTLNRYSNRYEPDGYPEPAEGELYPAGSPEGREWEIRTYLQLSI
jgi:hypothetical protein